MTASVTELMKYGTGSRLCDTSGLNRQPVSGDAQQQSVTAFQTGSWFGQTMSNVAGALEAGHGLFTAGSFLPGLGGAAFSLLDATLYAGQGDFPNAGLSLGAALLGTVTDAGGAKLALGGRRRKRRDLPIFTKKSVLPENILNSASRRIPRRDTLKKNLPAED